MWVKLLEEGEVEAVLCARVCVRDEQSSAVGSPCPLWMMTGVGLCSCFQSPVQGLLGEWQRRAECFLSVLLSPEVRHLWEKLHMQLRLGRTSKMKVLTMVLFVELLFISLFEMQTAT